MKTQFRKRIWFCLFLLVLPGCALKHSVLVTTQTVLGAQVAQNPTSQAYEAKFGYARNEFAIVPGGTNDPTAVPDVVTELRVENILKGGLIYQRLAVGKTAVAQPGAAFLFAKGTDGQLDSTTAAAVERSVRGVPAPDPSVTSSIVPLARAFATAPSKAAFDDVAKANGFSSFSDFLVNPALSPDKVAGIVAGLKAKGLIP